MRHEHEIGLELDCLSNTQISLGVAQCKILQSQSRSLGSYGTIPQLDQQLVNQNLVSKCENLPKLFHNLVF